MSAIPPEKPRRRPRYQGTHPRRFHEKYKEHQPEHYAADVAKIVASGKTPAGTHRAVMVGEVLEVLAPMPGEVAVDATLGYGGHAGELLKAILPGGRLIAMDVDPIELPRTEARLRAAGFPEESLVVRRSNFAGLPKVLAAAGTAGVDIILADLGLSSMQIDNPGRGFTFKTAGPLDLRMNPLRGQPASAFLASLDAHRLAGLLAENADEPHATLLGRAIAARQSRAPILTTAALATTIREALATLPGQRAVTEADVTMRRVFQALRIAVNDEFGALDTFLRQLPSCLRPGGRAAILTFHSGEDRRVKKAFQAGYDAGLYSRIAQEVIRPGAEEVRSNPRASSAKLRWAARAS